MNHSHTNVRRERAPMPLAACREAPFEATWREAAALAGGFLVLLVTAWLIWAALVEAALASAHGGSG